MSASLLQDCFGSCLKGCRNISNLYLFHVNVTCKYMFVLYNSDSRFFSLKSAKYTNFHIQLQVFGSSVWRMVWLLTGELDLWLYFNSAKELHTKLAWDTEKSQLFLLFCWLAGLCLEKAYAVHQQLLWRWCLILLQAFKEKASSTTRWKETDACLLWSSWSGSDHFHQVGRSWSIFGFVGKSCVLNLMQAAAESQWQKQRSKVTWVNCIGDW